MSEWIRWAFAVLFFAAGFFSIAVSVFGVFRFRYVLNRMQAAAIIDTFGILFITAGLILMAWDMAFVPKLLLVVLLQWIGSPIASHMVGRMEVRTDKNLKEYMKIRDLRNEEEKSAGFSETAAEDSEAASALPDLKNRKSGAETAGHAEEEDPE